MIPDMLQSLILNANMDEVIEHSFADFHVKGFDYINLHRSNAFTVKLYFFDNVDPALSEIVHPHNHRYMFDTYILKGRIKNVEYIVADEATGKPYERFKFDTPLNGGAGFLWDRSVFLREIDERTYVSGANYFLDSTDIHTLRIPDIHTVICLLQYRDELGLTETYCKDREPPSLDGLYTKPTADKVNQRIQQVFPDLHIL